MKHEEETIHRAIVSHLRTRGVHGLVFLHPANGGWRSYTEAARLQAMGVRAGASDLILLHDRHFYALELKTTKGKTTPAQVQFINDVKAAGGSGEVGYGLDSALEILKMWGLLQGRIQ